MEQIWEGGLGDGLEVNFWEEGLPLCVQSRFECLHGCSGHNILWQLVPVWDYSDVERIIKQTKKRIFQTAVSSHSFHEKNIFLKKINGV